MNKSQSQQAIALAKSVIRQDRVNIKKRINFLQKNLIQLSFYNKVKFESVDRSEFYKSLLHSLQTSKRLLKENKRIQSNL